MLGLGSLLRREPEAMIGLDVGSSSAKLVELGRQRSGQRVLLGCDSEPLSGAWTVDGRVADFEATVRALRRLVARSGTRTRKAAMALPSAAVITRRVALPAGLSERELQAQVAVEADRYLPYPVEEASLDFCPLGPSLTTGDEIDLLIASARREQVDEFQSLAEAAGLELEVLDVASFVSRRMVAHLNSPGAEDAGTTLALVEMAAHTTSLQVIQNDQLLYERDQAVGGAQLTLQIQQRYGLSPEEAEGRKRAASLPDDYPTAVLQPFLQTMAQEVARLLQFFYTSTAYGQVDRMLLAGGAAALAGLADAVQQSGGPPCSVADPFQGMALQDGRDGRTGRLDAPAYWIACGLAMRRFDP